TSRASFGPRLERLEERRTGEAHCCLKPADSHITNPQTVCGAPPIYTLNVTTLVSEPKPVTYAGSRPVIPVIYVRSRVSACVNPYNLVNGAARRLLRPFRPLSGFVPFKNRSDLRDQTQHMLWLLYVFGGSRTHLLEVADHGKPSRGQG